MYNEFGFVFNEDKVNIVENAKKPISFLGFEIMESKVYKFTKKQRQKSKIIIRPNKKAIIEQLVTQNILMDRYDLIPYAVKDSKKHQKNVRLKRKNEITTWAIDKKYKVLHYAPCLNEPPQKIIDYFNSKMYGLQSYYKYCDQYYILSQIFSMLRFSCFKTLANKYRCGTVRKLHNKFGENLEKIVKRYIMKLDTKKIPITRYLKNKKKNISDGNQIYEIFLKNQNSIWLSDTESAFGSCFICNTDKNLESHHVKSIKDLRSKIKPYKYNYYNYKYVLENPKQFFNIVHIIRNRKQVTLCFQCHSEIHNGTIESNTVIRAIKKLKKLL